MMKMFYSLVIIKSAFAQLRNIGLIRQYLTSYATKSLVNGLSPGLLQCFVVWCASDLDAQTPTGAELCGSHCDEKVKV